MVTATVRAAVHENKGKIEISRTMLWGLTLSLVGLLTASISIYLSGLVEASSRSFPHLLFDVLTLIGMAFFSMGIFSILLDTKGWKEYFEAGLKDIILQPEYLKTLSPEKLREHQIDILKTYYQDADIDREGRFLRYCLEHVHRYVVQPYRECIDDRIKVDLLDASLLRITDTLTYKCRRAGGGIQNRVFWQANSREVLVIEDLKMELRWPREPKEARRKINFDMTELVPKHKPDGSLYFEYDLSPHSQVDGLIVKIEAVYLVHQASFSTWRMSEPSRDVELSIDYPPEYELQFLSYLLDDEPDDQRHDRGFFYSRYRSWIMPKSGFVWKLLPRDLPSRVRSEGPASQLETMADILDDGGD